MKLNKTVVALSFVFMADNVMAGALDGGTINMVTDVAVTGAITSAGGYNITVGNGSIIGVGVPGFNSVFGANASVTAGSNNTVLGAGATAAAFNSVAIGSGSLTTMANSVSFGNATLGTTRVLQNVSNGLFSSDAANVGQVNTLIATAISSLPASTTDATARAAANAATVTANNADIKATTAIDAINTITPRVSTLETKINGFDGRLSGLENRIDKVEAGIASALAMSAANSNAASAANRSEKGRAIGIGASVFAGRSMTAISYASNFSFGTVTAAASLSASPSVQVGAGFAF